MSDFTHETVTDEIQDIRLVGLLYIEVLRVSPMVATGDELVDAANSLKIKNHIAYWAFIHPEDASVERQTIRFSMNVWNPTASIGSNVAQYQPSEGRSISSFGSDFSAPGNPTPPSDSASVGGPPSDSASVGGPPSDNAPPSNADLIAMLPEGPPADGKLDIKVRKYSGVSHSAVKHFAFPIVGEPKLRNFLDSLRQRHMFPFQFRKLGFAYLGCRHFASEAVEAWKEDKHIVDICEKTKRHFRDLISIRYSPSSDLPEDPMDSENEAVIEGLRETVNPIDRGIFPAEFKPLTAGYCFAD